IYNRSTKELTKKNLGIGVLGNLCLAPNGKSFYVITTKPDVSLRNISTDTFLEIKDFSLKGELFSNGDDPTDLITLSPDKSFLFVMTYINDPIPYTPVLTVIDPQKNKAKKRFSIKDETKPVCLSFKRNNPVGLVNKELEELLT